MGEIKGTNVQLNYVYFKLMFKVGRKTQTLKCKEVLLPSLQKMKKNKRQPMLTPKYRLAKDWEGNEITFEMGSNVYE